MFSWSKWGKYENKQKQTYLISITFIVDIITQKLYLNFATTGMLHILNQF